MTDPAAPEACVDPACTFAAIRHQHNERSGGVYALSPADPFAGVTFPDADTERAVRLGAAWPGSIEDDIAAMPADKMFDR